MLWAILTGDIVESSDMSASELDALIHALDHATREMTGWGDTPQDRTVTGFARRGGDGWQIALNRPALALRAALFVQATVRALDARFATRIAAATGEGDPPAAFNADLNGAHGPVFRASGRLLEELSGHSLMAHADGGALDAAFRLADHISQGWTQAQARAVAAMLPPNTGPRRVVANALGISRQAVDQSLNAAGYPALDAALSQIEAGP